MATVGTEYTTFKYYTIKLTTTPLVWDSKRPGSDPKRRP